MDTFGGAAWNASINHAGTKIAVPCEDGGIRIFDISTPGSIKFSGSLLKHQRKI